MGANGNGGQPDLRNLFALKAEKNRADQQCLLAVHKNAPSGRYSP
jgi:hypothetical protein